MARHIGIFGGAFNPPHIGHVVTVQTALSLLDLDEVWVIPCWEHAFDKNALLAPFDDRYCMTQLAMTRVPRVKVLDIEKSLRSKYMFQVFRHIKTILEDDATITLIVGVDNARDLKNNVWLHADEILSTAKLFVVDRAVDTPSKIVSPHTVSSTQIRQAIAGEQKLDLERALPRQVREYINTHKLYGSGSKPHPKAQDDLSAISRLLAPSFPWTASATLVYEDLSDAEANSPRVALQEGKAWPNFYCSGTQGVAFNWLSGMVDKMAIGKDDEGWYVDGDSVHVENSPEYPHALALACLQALGLKYLRETVKP